MTLARLLNLRADLRDPDAAAEVTPEALAAYAERTGWHLATTTPAHRVYRRGEAELQVPLTAGWPDYGKRICQEIGILARAEDRSPLAIWAELIGLTDTAADTAQALDKMLAELVTMPSMYARTPEVLLMQALLAANIRARLRGDPDVDDRYDAARLRRGIPTSTHACDRLDLAGTASLIAEMVGLPPPEPPDETAQPPSFTGRFTGDPAPPVPSQRPKRAQGVLPGFAAGPPAPRHTRHVFGIFEMRSIAAGPLAPEAIITGLVRACKHCDCLHRVTSAGPRLGAENLYSTNGGTTWSTASPPCILKRPSEDRR